ncbi:MAG TPA: hypothetical protein VKV28_01420 [Candidatus Binataceae bacterium]|nr:hypothetical protein [Candidatus Binataceae bacterium]
MRRMIGLGVLAAILMASSGAGSAAYSVASLNGTCLWDTLFYPTSAGIQNDAGPAAVLAPLTFDGAGHLSFTYDINLNGTFSSTANVNGTYTIDATGHGSLSYNSPATGKDLIFDFRISPNGHVLRTIFESYGGEPATPRVGAGVCTFAD